MNEDWGGVFKCWEEFGRIWEHLGGHWERFGRVCGEFGGLGGPRGQIHVFGPTEATNSSILEAISGQKFTDFEGVSTSTGYRFIEGSQGF
jgi:hypothetical protein